MGYGCVTSGIYLIGNLLISDLYMICDYLLNQILIDHQLAFYFQLVINRLYTLLMTH